MTKYIWFWIKKYLALCKSYFLATYIRSSYVVTITSFYS